MNAIRPPTESRVVQIAVRPDTRVDWTRCFIGEEFTPLFHTREFQVLPAVVRLRYNQMHALYFNEQVAFFEQEMLSPALLAFTRMSLPRQLAAGVRDFFEEEQRHTAMFRALNHRCAPQFYSEQPYHFVQVARPWRRLLHGMARRPGLFPLFLWLALMQEERSLFYSKGCLNQAAELEPQFVAVHRSHLADEVAHVGWDEELLDWIWPRVGRVVRWLNVRLLRWMVREFFLLPKRSGLRVVRQLAREFPQLDLNGLNRGMAGLERNSDFLRTLYSRTITPRTFARFDADPDFAIFAKTFVGYSPCDPSQS